MARTKLPQFLRDRAKDFPAHHWALADICDEAAEEIERLRERIEELEDDARSYGIERNLRT